MKRIEQDIELAKKQILELTKMAKVKGYPTVREYIIENGEIADNVRDGFLSVADIIESKETNALYTTNWMDGEFVVKILGPYSPIEMEEGGWEYHDYYGIKNVVLFKWDGRWDTSPSTITNGWSSPYKNVGLQYRQTYKIYPLEANIFINWNSNPLNS